MHEICCTCHSSQTNLYNGIVLLLCTSLLFMFLHRSWFKSLFYFHPPRERLYIVHNERHCTIHLDDNLELEQEDLAKCFSVFMALIYVFNLAYPKQCTQTMMFDKFWMLTFLSYGNCESGGFTCVHLLELFYTVILFLPINSLGIFGGWLVFVLNVHLITCAPLAIT